jgi:hypothetical protein
MGFLGPVVKGAERLTSSLMMAKGSSELWLVVAGFAFLAVLCWCVGKREKVAWRKKLKLSLFLSNALLNKRGQQQQQQQQQQQGDGGDNDGSGQSGRSDSSPVQPADKDDESQEEEAGAIELTLKRRPQALGGISSSGITSSSSSSSSSSSGVSIGGAGDGRGGNGCSVDTHCDGGSGRVDEELVPSLKNLGGGVYEVTLGSDNDDDDDDGDDGDGDGDDEEEKEGVTAVDGAQERQQQRVGGLGINGSGNLPAVNSRHVSRQPEGINTRRVNNEEENGVEEEEEDDEDEEKEVQEQASSALALPTLVLGLAKVAHSAPLFLILFTVLPGLMLGSLAWKRQPVEFDLDFEAYLSSDGTGIDCA